PVGNRQIFCEDLISQKRNGIAGLTGPGVVLVGGTYTYLLHSTTATGGYEQMETFIGFPSSGIRTLNIFAAYTVPTGATNDTVYADACGWQNDTNAGAAYNSCVGPCNFTGCKAGGSDIFTTY